MSNEEKHKRVDAIYKAILIVLAMLTIFLIEDPKISLFIFTVLWIMKDEIEHFIEDMWK